MKVLNSVRVFILLATAIAFVVCSAAAATAGTTLLTFEHTHSTTIVEYRALLGTTSGVYTQEFSLGLPTASGTLYSAPLQIPDNTQVFIAVVAVDDNGLRSAPSNERVRFSSQTVLGAPGQPQLPAGSN